MNEINGILRSIGIILLSIILMSIPILVTIGFIHTWNPVIITILIVIMLFEWLILIVILSNLKKIFN